jgi:hypothetical protein
VKLLLSKLPQQWRGLLTAAVPYRFHIQARWPTHSRRPAQNLDIHIQSRRNGRQRLNGW